MYATGLRASLAAAAVLSTALIAVPAAATPDAVSPQADSKTVQTLTVTRDSLPENQAYAKFEVPNCTTAIAYVMDGAAGGSAGTLGEKDYAKGGAGMILSGVMKVSGGEVLYLYPSGKGAVAGKFEDGGAGGAGYRNGGAGSSSGITSTPSKRGPGGGGGGSSAITLDVTPLAVTPGGGGAGGIHTATTPAMDSNKGTGGAGEAKGAHGTNYSAGNKANWGGAVGWTDDGNGETGPKMTTEVFAGAGGGGGGYRGGGAGGVDDAPNGSAWGPGGGGGGGGGTSFVDSSRVSTTETIADYGLSESDLDPLENGEVRIAYVGCESTLNVQGTTTLVSGSTGVASGWGQELETTGNATPSGGVLDSTGQFTSTISGYEASSKPIPVTVIQEERTGWVMQDWSETSQTAPLARCKVTGGAGEPLTVTNLSANSYSVSVPEQSVVTCVSNTVELKAEMAVVSYSTDTLTNEKNPTSVASSTPVLFEYVVQNKGNIPLEIKLTDPKVSSPKCQVSELLPGASTTCSGTVNVTAD